MQLHVTLMNITIRHIFCSRHVFFYILNYQDIKSSSSYLFVYLFILIRND